MSFNLASICSDAVIKAPRIIVLGTEKIGKTTFSCGSRVEGGRVVEVGLNSPVVISVKGEEGADGIAVPKFPVAQNIDDIMSAIGSLYSGEHKFKTVVLDSASALSPIIYDDVCQEFGVSNIRKVPGFRTGEAAIQARWRTLLSGLTALREDYAMSSILIGHVKVKPFKNPEGDNYDTYDFDLDSEVAEMLKRWADLILFCNTKTIIKKEGEDSQFSKAKKRGMDISGGQRFLYTQKRPSHPGGGREAFGNLPYELPLDWESFQTAIQEACSVSQQ